MTEISRLGLVAIIVVLAIACTHSPPVTASYTVEIRRDGREMVSFRALGSHEISGGLSAVCWYSESDAPVLASGLVVAGLEFTASSNPDGAFVMPMALVGTQKERRHRDSLVREREQGFQVAPGEVVVVSHLADGTKLPFALQFTVHASEYKPKETS